MVAISDKKAQKATIEEIKKRLEDYRAIIERLAGRKSGHATDATMLDIFKACDKLLHKVMIYLIRPFHASFSVSGYSHSFCSHMLYVRI